MEENSFLSKEAQQQLAEEIYKEYLSIRAGESVVLIGTPISVVDAIRLAALRRVLASGDFDRGSLRPTRTLAQPQRCPILHGGKAGTS